MQLGLAILLILSSSWFLGRCFQRFGQPPVIGEIIAGVALGPSLLGWWAPEWQQSLFQPAHLEIIAWPAQIGLFLFLFFVGLESKPAGGRRPTVMLLKVWMGSLFIPLLMGAALGWWLFASETGAVARRGSFIAFIAIATAVTAFPVLVRLLEDKGWHRRSLGRLAMGVASLDDLFVWVMLSVVITHEGNVVLHGLFIAFVLGWLLSSTRLASTAWRQPVSKVIAWLMPFFFVLSGLRTDLTLLRNLDGLHLLVVVLAVAIVAKIGGTWLGARWAGLKPRPALVLGVLMNTRGLVELVVLNMGLKAGLLSPRLFAIFVVMALVTTLMTGPILFAMHAPREMDE